MGTPSRPASSFKEKLYKNQRGELYFTLVICPACRLEFRLLWPASFTKYQEKAKLNLKCPGCHHSFSSLDLGIRDICNVGAGCCGRIHRRSEAQCQRRLGGERRGAPAF